jgi:hypothetical protein
MSPYRRSASTPAPFKFPRIDRSKAPDLWVQPFLLSLAVTLAVVVWVVIPVSVPGVDVFADPMCAK